MSVDQPHSQGSSWAVDRRAIIIVCDSLGRQSVGADTPALNRLLVRSVSFARHTGIFPSATRVTSASLATGCLPMHHGLMGNAIALDEGAGLQPVSVGVPEFVERYRAFKGRTLRRPTLAALVRRVGGSKVFSNASAGAAYLQDPDGHGYVYHGAGSFGPGRAPLLPKDGVSIASGAEGDRALTERFCAQLRRDDAPALNVIWLSEPDHTSHLNPPGSPAHRAAVKSADDNVALIISTVAETWGESEEVLLVACSDHGNQTVRRTIDVNAALVEAGLKASSSSTDVLAVSQGTSSLIYFSKEAASRVEAVASFLRGQDWAGAVFAGETLNDVGLATEDGLAVAVAMAASDAPNAFGVPGLSDLAADPFSPGDHSGCGQHGGLAEFEQAPFLTICGPGFAPGTVDHRKTTPMDIAPSVLRHLGLTLPPMDGRPLQAWPERGLPR